MPMASTTAAYPNPNKPQSKSSVTRPDPCSLCEGNGWVLVERNGRVLAARCECLSPHVATTPRPLDRRWSKPGVLPDVKSRAAGDVE
jgi:hypothetical protein